MHKFFYIAVILSLLSTPVYAQTPSNPFGNRNDADTSNSYSPPAVFVTKINLDPQKSNEKLSGKFTIWNTEKQTIGGLLYRIDFLDPLPQADKNSNDVQDTATIYDRYVSNEPFYLAPDEQREISFSYDLPNVPGGKYRIEITATNSLGRDMGWWDADVQIADKNIPFLKIITGPVHLPEFPNRDIPSQAGPNVNPGSSFSVNIKAVNEGQSIIKALPVMELYEFDVARGKLSTTKGTIISVDPQKIKDISFPITASNKPAVYYGILYLTDPASGKKISNLTEYRWIVRGDHAEIISQRVNGFVTRKGEKMNLRVDMVGPADAETKVKVKFTIQITDQNGLVGEAVANGLELSDAVLSTNGQIELKRNLQDKATVILTLHNEKDGKELDRVQMPLEGYKKTNKATAINERTILYGGIAIILLAIIAFVITSKRLRFPKQ
jgi:hypothetical protein